MLLSLSCAMFSARVCVCVHDCNILHWIGDLFLPCRSLQVFGKLCLRMPAGRSLNLRPTDMHAHIECVF